MRVLHKKFPGCFLTGTVPAVCFSPKTDRKGRLKPAPKVTDNPNVEWYNPERIFSEWLYYFDQGLIVFHQHTH